MVAVSGGQPGKRTTDATIIGGIEEPENGTVKNYRSVDDAILKAQGHEAALKRSFSLLSSLGLAFGYVQDLIPTVERNKLTNFLCQISITNSWVGLLSNFGQNLQYGGPPLAVWSVLIACFVQWTITLGLSELASAFPSSGVRPQIISFLFH